MNLFFAKCALVVCISLAHVQLPAGHCLLTRCQIAHISPPWCSWLVFSP